MAPIAAFLRLFLLSCTASSAVFPTNKIFQRSRTRQSISSSRCLLLKSKSGTSRSRNGIFAISRVGTELANSDNNDMQKLQGLDGDQKLSSWNEKPMRVLAVDFGTKRTGLALGVAGMAYQSLPIQLQAVFSQKDYVTLADKIISVATTEKVSGIVVGVPVGDSLRLEKHRLGTTQASRCRKFAQLIANKLARNGAENVNVYLVDEAGTSRMARDKMGISGDKRVGKGSIDSTAAEFIAQAYFEGPEQALKVTAKLSTAEGKDAEYGSEAWSYDRLRGRMSSSGGYKKKWTKDKKS